MKFAPDGSPLTRWTRLSLAGIVTLAGMCLALAANVVYDTVKDCAQTPLGIFSECVIDAETPTYWKYGLAGILMLICAMVSYFGVPVIRKALLNSYAHMRRKHGQLPQFPGVVFALSFLANYQAGNEGLPLRNLEKPSNTTAAVAKALDIVASMKDGSLEAQKAALDTLCDADGEFAKLRWSWQQPLRVLRHNHGELSVFCAILSREAETQFALFERIATPLLRPGTVLVRVTETVERDNYNHIIAALDTAIKLVQGKVGDNPENICVDTTGGTAIYSAAAVVKTLNSKLKLSYIPTFDGPDAGKIVIFDAAISA